MKFIVKVAYIFIVVGFIYSSTLRSENAIQLKIIPYPQTVLIQKGFFSFSPSTVIYSNLKGTQKQQILDLVQSSSLCRLKPIDIDQKCNSLRLILAKKKYSNIEEYMLNISPQGITIEASTNIGLFYGLQSLFQIIEQFGLLNIPSLKIVDYPYLKYRGLMIDLSRHYFPLSFLLKQLDLMAYFKLNVLHCHLVDGAGWRLYIRNYPELTNKSGWRPFVDIRTWEQSKKPYCDRELLGAYGGYYTQQDIKELVNYAQQRHITIIPEIEMPGHSEEVLAVKPQISCSGKSYVNSEFCIGNKKTYVFLKNVLKEVISLFPSKYIHIGGDEADTIAWSICPKCRALMKKEGLKEVKQLQSLFIRRMEKYINSKGRRLIGWDEIMGDASNANSIIMSWRSQDNGLLAADSGHDVVMSPIQYCYFNFYQDSPLNQTLAWAGYTSLEKTYSFNPIPDSISEKVKDHIVGVQGNVWTEYISTQSEAEKMIWPRELAIAETGWSLPQNKSYERFKSNVIAATDFMKQKGYDIFDLRNEIGERKKFFQKLNHLARGKEVTYLEPFSNDYSGGGKNALTDGLQGGWSVEDGRWQGFNDNNMDVIIDLGQTQTIHSVKATFVQDIIGWFFLPRQVNIYISSDNINYSLLSSVTDSLPSNQTGYFIKTLGWCGETKTRYIRYVAHLDDCNKKMGYIVTDEIVVQ